ncbi:TPA: type II/IV secretion system protein [Mannheimia haemolytica]|uniref:Type II traffic warden ATPase n=1 Tax=Mannheimia haemolytica TaxID=75985 RepID=A0A378NHR6_MANHA|nr:GspE/PulE family protein [Mannheimia haemolytica]AGQ39714.1 protein transporter HofB [Mannheimia haemolytica D171]EEY10188.1 type II secretion system protein E [Mannheimia haemolytica serotype A2 str. OVINE]EEY11955.1 type II secretion system protein E [Mannheimia haemolytica serotype A2 str. BOVINE]KYL22764.1 protein transporter HofB [Mannheimia haemolytica]MDW0534944.1 GspE/PulE family protein [Mannheimia haemolytica]
MEYSVTDLNSQRFIEISAEQWQKNCNEKQILLRYLAVPLQETAEQLWLGIDDMQNLNACEIFAFIYHKQIEPVLISSEELKFLLNALSPEQSSPQSEIYEENPLYPFSENTEQPDRNDPIIQILENLFKFCLQQNASDIHLEPQKERLLIRLRIDGVLHIYKSLPSSLSSRLISRVKLLAKLDISETRLPQDGQFHFKTLLAETLDFRVSTLPTHFGEKVVLRLQKNKPTHFDFLDLGFNPTQKANLLNALSQPQGLILVTGPTGSGKSITLYSALSHLNSSEKHILTAEDPIEIEIEGIIQTQVNRGINLDFSQLLRTFLRQDPDIIMLGEIRDEESAEMALRAAQTGHLVLSTLHTNDAPSAVERLLQLGIKEYELKNSLLLVIAQRLLRRVCVKCGGAGCEHCYQGYKGRIGVYQLLNRSAKNFEKNTACLDFKTLADSAKEKLTEGKTNQAEILRVLGNDENL